MTQRVPEADGALPTVSVVVPCYKYGHFLPGCVESLLSQEGVDVRILIIDDASPDGSGDVAFALAESDPRIEARVHERNMGHIATYNEGLLEWADRDYCVLLSADDELTPGSLARSTKVLEDNPSVGFVYSHSPEWLEGAPKPKSRTETTGVVTWKGLDWYAQVCELGYCVTSPPTVMIRTALHHEVGGYLPSLPHTGDFELWLRLAAHADVAYIQGVDQAIYRVHGTQMTVQRVPLIDLQQRKDAFDAVLAAHGERVPDAPRLHRAADRKLAKEALWRACRAYERRRMDSVPIQELHDFARDSYADYKRLPEYWGLRWRRQVGPKITPYLQPLMLSAVHRKLRTGLAWRRLSRSGMGI
jgi:glycosyltransferase involved in cell wall biosynthesis